MIHVLRATIGQQRRVPDSSCEQHIAAAVVVAAVAIDVVAVVAAAVANRRVGEATPRALRLRCGRSPFHLPTRTQGRSRDPTTTTNEYAWTPFFLTATPHRRHTSVKHTHECQWPPLFAWNILLTNFMTHFHLSMKTGTIGRAKFSAIF